MNWSGGSLRRNTQPRRHLLALQAERFSPRMNLAGRQESQVGAQGVRHLVVAGMMTHLAIDATVRSAYDRGFTTTILHDACATRDLEFHGTQIPAHTVQNAFLAALQPLYAHVMGTRELLQRINRQIAVPA